MTFPISLWQAGGESSARILLALLNNTRVLGGSALGMRGGRMQELYKHKGDRNETNSHWGILVQDLLGAIQASFLKCDIDEHHMKFIHETHCGCAKGRGTCMAGQNVVAAANFSTHDVRLMQSALKALNISDEVCEQIIEEAVAERNMIRRTGATSGRPGQRQAHSHLARVQQMRCQTMTTQLCGRNEGADKGARQGALLST